MQIQTLMPVVCSAQLKIEQHHNCVDITFHSGSTMHRAASQIAIRRSRGHCWTSS